MKQHFRVTYQGSILEKTISRESIAAKVISKVNARLNVLHQKNKYLTPNLRHLALLYSLILIMPAQHGILNFLKN